MKFWSSGEVQSDIADDFRVVRKAIDDAINLHLANNDYGESVEKWDHIAIIRAVDSSDYAEINKYAKRSRTIELRLKIDHGLFKASGINDRYKLFGTSVLRGLEIAGEMKIPGFAVSILFDDILGLLKVKGWI